MCNSVVFFCLAYNNESLLSVINNDNGFSQTCYIQIFGPLTQLFWGSQRTCIPNKFLGDVDGAYTGTVL